MKLGSMTTKAVQEAGSTDLNKPIRNVIKETAGTIIATARLTRKVVDYANISMAMELDSLIADATMDNVRHEQELASATTTEEGASSAN